MLCFLLAASAFGEPIETSVARSREFHREEAARLTQIFVHRDGVQTSQRLDVLHYDLNLRIDPHAGTIAGAVSMQFTPTALLNTVKMRLKPPLQVTQSTLDSVVIHTDRRDSDLLFQLQPPLQKGSSHILKVSYSGKPSTLNDFTGGIFFDAHGGTPSATTLSEPFDSFVWWPCIDNAADKVTSDVTLTVPPGMLAASNGILVSTSTAPDGWKTFHWRESYPISNYLISANVTNYSTFSATYTSLDGKKKMPIRYYVYPENVQQARINFRNVPQMIRVFASMVGEYPFLNEKYGMVSFPWGGGMEHQTLTSIKDSSTSDTGNFDLLFSHELAHQWFGDDVTCATWNDIWLNEGFATYFEVLWGLRSARMSEGDYMATYFDDGQYDGFMGGSVHLSDGNHPFNDTGAVYEKGAWVLHMLKSVLGQAPFFRALRNYRTAHAYSNASTADLQAACEAVYGKSMAWFFDQWVYTPYRPIYQTSFHQNGSFVNITVTQRQGHSIAHRSSRANVYIMPVELTLHFADGTSTAQTVWNDQREQTFTLPASKTVTSIGFDEAHRILRTR